jgi:hypothetical protein
MHVGEEEWTAPSSPSLATRNTAVVLQETSTAAVPTENSQQLETEEVRLSSADIHRDVRFPAAPPKPHYQRRRQPNTLRIGANQLPREEPSTQQRRWETAPPCQQRRAPRRVSHPASLEHAIPPPWGPPCGEEGLHPTEGAPLTPRIVEKAPPHSTPPQETHRICPEMTLPTPSPATTTADLLPTAAEAPRRRPPPSRSRTEARGRRQPPR